MEDNFAIQTLSTQENVAGVKARLRKEGREARNLIAYSLPLGSWKISFSSPTNEKDIEKLNKRSITKEKKLDNARFKQSKRHRSASAGRDPQACLRARHWGFLFRNLQQAVDEIYQTAEDDESIIECKEAILMLERYTNDFYKLIDWFKIKWEYENSSPPQRPTSLAWEIRTSSPGKAFKYDRRNITAGDTKKTLNFNQSSLSSVKPKTDVIPETCDSSSVEKVIPTIKINTRDKNSNASSLANGSNISVQKGFYDSNQSMIEEQIATKKEDNGEICFNDECGNNNSVLHKNKSVNFGSYNDLNSDLIDISNEKSIESSVIDLQTLSQTFLSQDKPSTLYASILKDDKSDNFDFTKDTIENKSPETSLKDKMSLQVEYNSDSNKGRASIINTSTTRNKYKEQKIFTETKKADQKKHSTDYQIKQFHSKPGPLVNMNKASQVRQAFNQNKTPIKSNSVSGWKPHYTFTFSENKVLCSKQGKESSVIFEGNGSSNISLNSGSNNPATSSSFIHGQSWADKVKGNAVGDVGEKMPSSKVFIKDDDDGHDIDDNEGWEVVRRHKRNHGSAGSVNSKLSSKSTYCDEEMKVKYPHKMKSRFHHPSSAISLPSLHSSSDINERLERNSLPGNCFISQNWSVNSKESKHNVKKLHTKNKRFQKQSSEINGIRNSNCYRICKVTSMNNHCKTTVFHRETKNKEENIDNEKLKKDAANAKTQSGSNLSSSREKVDEFEAHLKLPSNGNVSCEEPSIDNQIKDFDAGDGSSDKRSLFPVVMNEEGLKNKVYPTLTSKTGFNKLFCPNIISESQSGNESDNEEEKLRCNAEAFECAIKREKKLKEEIEETKNAPIEICSADDEDGEADIDSYEMFGSSAEINSQNEICNLKNDFENVSIQTGFLNWADEMDEVDKVESIRPPGRVLHIHEKLSSPSRKLPISEKLRRHKEKLAKAQELRGKLMLAKTEKLKDLFRKIDEVNIDKERLLLEKRDLFERKMERAEEKRRVHLQEIINKAHDEENKAKEIAFINGLEAQNKLHDIMQQHQSHESRMADMAEERSRKLEEKAAKEAAAQERRKVLEEERKARMLELCEKRRKRYERIDRQQAERREELLEQAREKARDREERRCALQQAQQAKESELVKKIQQKQEETARRHEENIEQIRQKALESSIMKYSRGCDEAPKLRRYETKKLCTLCNSVITSEVYLLSHLRSFQHEESLKVLNKRDISLEETETFNLKYIVNAPPNIVDSQVIKDKERLKALKKRCRKIRTRMNSRGREFLKHYNNPTFKDSVVKNRISKSLTQIGKLVSSQGTGPWLASDVSFLDKNLLELIRILEKNGDDEQKIFASLDGFRRLLVILEQILCEEETPCVIPSRSLSICARILHAATKNSNENSLFLLFSNLVGNIIDQLNRRLNEMSLEFSRNGSSSSLNSITLLPSDPVATSLMELLSQILHDAKPENNCSEVEKNDCFLRSQDVVSYCVSMGVTDKISWYFNHVQNPVENDPSSADIILSATSLLSALSEKLCERPQCGDPTQLIETFRVLDACGVVSLLYGLLLHQGGRSPTPPMASLLSASTLAISAAATTLLYRLAELDLETFQTILGSEGISLEFRHIASFLLWYCTHWPCEEILHNVIALVGFFAINNKENQCIIQSGETPSVLQQLCSLPWQYFSEPRLTDVLFPTLLACCLNNHDNLNILQQEMSFQILEDYLKNNKASKRTVMQILYSLCTI